MQILTRDFHRQQRNVRLLVIAGLLLLGAALAAVLLYQRERIIAREAERLQSQVRVIEANLIQRLESLAAALQSVLDDKPALAKPQGLNSQASARLRTLSDAMPSVRTMVMTDAAGRVQASNRLTLIGADASVRAFFQVARSQLSPQTLHVSEPYTTALKAYSVNLTRSFQDDRGQFAGVVAATLDPAYFQVLLSSVLYANDMRAVLVHGRGLVFLTMPVNPAIVGSMVARDGTMFSQHRQEQQKQSLHIGKVGLTSEERMFVFHTIQPPSLHMDQPLVLSVSRGMQAVLADWRETAIAASLSYSALSVLLMLSLVQMQRKNRMLMEMTRVRAADSQHSEERLALALAGADLGLWDLDMQTGERHVNARAQHMVGLAADAPALTQAEWVGRIHPDDRPRVHTQRMADEMGRTDLETLEYRVQHADGHWVWLQVRGKVVARGPLGQPLRSTGTYLDISERKASAAGRS